MSKEIELSQGLKAIIDDEDFEKVSAYKWHAVKVKKKYYAKTNNRHLKGPKLFRLHRLIFGFPKGEIDHINGNGLDNRKENLRICTHRQNSYNKIKSRGTSIYKGVSWDKKLKNWLCGIKVNYKRKFIGNFESEIDAAKAYDEAAKKYFGEFARTNF